MRYHDHDHIDSDYDYRRLHRHDCPDGMCGGCERCVPGIDDDDHDDDNHDDEE